MSDINQIFQDILARLRAQVPFDVYDSDSYDDDQLPSVSGVMKPHLVVWLGDNETERSGRGRGIVSPVLDPIRYDVIIDAVAPTGDAASTLRTKALEALLGYKPLNSAPMTLDAFRGYSTQQNDVKPKIYHRACLMRGVGNL